MLTGTVWGFTLIALGVVVTFAATQVLLATVFARRIDAARGVLRTRPWVSALVGVLGAVAAVVAVAVVKSVPQLAGLLGLGAGILAIDSLLGG